AGYADDNSKVPWGPTKKGLIDAAIALGTTIAICKFQDTTIWLPFTSKFFSCPFWLYIPIGTGLLWIMINSTNCTDGVDGLAGVLSVIPLLFLAGYLYVIGGHEKFANYLLVPHLTDGAPWAILIMSFAGALSSYLWYNAEPSQLLMGDAGSRAIGLLLGIAILTTGNFFIALAVAPVILINGGAGLVKLGTLRILKKLGIDIENHPEAKLHIKALHKYRFPFHDHCRKELKWSNA
ncbi:MAG: hypothetical protein OIF34_04995, partial [Porticoccaceae bacterium]|nr:hypothetical protein [Porticoccaceae bacterium]